MRAITLRAALQCAVSSAILIGANPLRAQTTSSIVLPPQLPLSDTNCSYPDYTGTSIVGLPLAQNCPTPGTRTVAAPVITQTPINATTTRVRADWQVNYSGPLVVDGYPVLLKTGGSLLFDASLYFDPSAVAANVSVAYTGYQIVNSTNVASTITSFNSGTPGAFLNWNVQSSTVNALSVNVQNASASSVTTGRSYSYSLTSPSSTIINGNAVNLSGHYQTHDDNGALIFGNLGGAATLVTSATTPYGTILDSSGNPTGGWRSLYGLQFNVIAQETTRLDETGLVTPTVSVTNGIAMNESKVTGLADGTAPTDAVNKGQLDTVAAAATTAQASAAAASAVAIDARNTANTALAGAATAQATANTALAAAGGARTTADTALANSAAAQTTANTALATATDARTTAGVALASATTAQTTANSAMTLASTLQTSVTAAQGAASTAAQRTQFVSINSASGTTPVASGVNAIALGQNAQATGGSSLAIGVGAVAQNGMAVSLGAGNRASGNGAVAIGDPNVAVGTGAVAVGNSNTANGQGSVAIGNTSAANG